MKRQTLDDLTRFVVTAVLGTVAIVAVAPFLRPAVLPPWLEGPSRGLRSHAFIANTADSLTHALLWRAPAPPPPRTSAAPVSTVSKISRWGLTCVNDAPTYRVNGDFFRRIPAGSALVILDTRESTAGLLYRCKMPPPDPGFDEFLVPATSLNVYTGTLDTMPGSVMELHQRYARLQADLKRAKRPPSGEVREDNPHLAAFRSAKSKSDSFSLGMRDLQKRFPNAVGDERMRIEDELRSSRGKGIDLERELDAARERYDGWNAEHPSPDNLNTPEVKRLETELASVEAQMGKSSGTP